MSEEHTSAKPWWQSLTIWAGLLTMLSSLGFAGLSFDPATGDFTGNIFQLWASLTTTVTGAATVWGRIRATVRVGK